jgi:hypothetical protein
VDPWVKIVFLQPVTELNLDSDKSNRRLNLNHSEQLHGYFPVCFHVDQVKPNSTDFSTTIIQEVSSEVLSAMMVKFPVFELQRRVLERVAPRVSEDRSPFIFRVTWSKRWQTGNWQPKASRIKEDGMGGTYSKRRVENKFILMTPRLFWDVGLQEYETYIIIQNVGVINLRFP